MAIIWKETEKHLFGISGDSIIIIGYTDYGTFVPI